MSVPMYCPHKGCGWSYDSNGKTGNDYLTKHLKIVHKGAPLPEVKQVRLVLKQPGAPGRPMVSAETAIKALQAAAVELGRTPSLSWWVSEHRKPSQAVYTRLFGGWRAAIAAAGLEQNTPAHPKPAGEVSEPGSSAAVADTALTAEHAALPATASTSSVLSETVGERQGRQPGSLTSPSSPGLLSFLTDRCPPGDLIVMLTDARARHARLVAMAEEARTEAVVLQAAIDSLRAAA